LNEEKAEWYMWETMSILRFFEKERSRVGDDEKGGKMMNDLEAKIGMDRSGNIDILSR